MPKRIGAIIILGILMVTSATCWSQGLSSSEWNAVRGTITNEDQVPVEFATISLFQADAFIKSSITSDSGTFRIPNLEAGRYRLQIDHMEYTTQSVEFSILEDEDKVLPTILLQRARNSLEEVVITKKKEIIEVQPDKVVFNVSSSPSASGVNGMDLLRKAPGVTVDFDNSIALLGKSNVQIYINGVQSRLSGNDLVNFLQSLTSDVIDSIEIITNPGSRYEAEGTGGVINIRLKKSVATGWNGSVASGITKGEAFRYNNNLSFNLGTGKLQLNADVTHSYNDYLERFEDDKTQNNAQLILSSKENAIHEGYNFGLGLDYQFNKKHAVGLSTRAILGTTDVNLRSTTDIYQLDPPEYNNLLLSRSIADGSSNNYLMNAYHTWYLDDTSNLMTNASFGFYDSQRETEQPNTYFGPDGETIETVDNVGFDSDTQINLASVKLDYEKSWSKLSLEAGFKYSNVKTQNSFLFYAFDMDVPIVDPERSNDFDYTEEVTAAYASFKYSPSEKFSVNAGVRMEHTESRGQLFSETDVENKDVKRQYTDYFPSFGLSYDLSEDDNLGFSLGRRITRPNYQDLNPFESPTSQLVIWKGNPFLNPNYVMNYQLSYSRKSNFLVSAYYSLTTDYFARIVEVTGEESTQIIPRNMEKSITYGLTANYTLHLFDFWDINFGGNTYNISFEGDVESAVIDLSVWRWSYRIQNNIKLPLDMQLELTWVQYNRWIWRGTVYIEGNESVNFGLRKDFLDGNVQLRVVGSDIFRTDTEYPYESNYGGIDLNGTYIGDNQRFGINATWKFGNSDTKSRRRNNALEDELNRIQD